ncbi:unnamed protein product, partial [Brenthis ino]
MRYYSAQVYAQTQVHSLFLSLSYSGGTTTRHDRCVHVLTMMYTIPVFIIALSAALAAPAFEAASTGVTNDQYPFETDKNNFSEEIFMPQKRAALVLDRLLIALQKALHEESVNQRVEADRDGPRMAPLRLGNFEGNDMTGLQRRGQGSTRGRVLRCYFNAITCF